jgi:hypothetical protein
VSVENYNKIRVRQLQNPKWNFPAKVYFGVGVLLLIAAAPLPYGFYTFIRIIICGFSTVLSYNNFKTTHNNSIWPWFFLLLAVLFNPFIPIHMEKNVWMIIDIILGAFFIFLAYKTKIAESGRQG